MHETRRKQELFSKIFDNYSYAAILPLQSGYYLTDCLLYPSSMAAVSGAGPASLGTGRQNPRASEMVSN